MVYTELEGIVQILVVFAKSPSNCKGKGMG